MKALIIAALLVSSCYLSSTIAYAAVAPPPLSALDSFTFDKYVLHYGKKYNTLAEAERRRAIYEKNIKMIRAHNADTTQTFKMNINHMADWTHEEFMRLQGSKAAAFNRVNKNINNNNNNNNNGGHKSNAPPALSHVRNINKMNNNNNDDTNKKPLPRTVDYRARVPTVLTAVKDQGQCGSCWAHAAVAQLESMWALATDQLYVLSQQQLTACAPNPHHCGGDGGCQGSTAELAYDYVVSAGGIVEEWQYPYTAYTGTTGKCLPQDEKFAAKFNGKVRLETNDQRAVMESLAMVGPLAVNVAASSWQFYHSGVFTNCPYNESIEINHVVQLVGYGYDSTVNMAYWIVRNSWSAGWGENGYIRLQRDEGEKPRCGTDDDPSQGTGCNDGPNTTTVCGMCGLLFDASYPLPMTSNN